MNIKTKVLTCVVAEKINRNPDFIKNFGIEKIQGQNGKEVIKMKKGMKIAIAALAVAYIVSPVDLLSGIPVDDAIVALTTIAGLLKPVIDKLSETSTTTATTSADNG